MRYMMMLPMVLAPLAALAACGPASDQNSEQAGAPVNSAQAETGAAAQVAKLDEGLRNGVFEKAIRDSGAACPSVTVSARAQISPGVAGWKAQCDNGSAHLIQILDDGTAKVTSRRE